MNIFKRAGAGLLALLVIASSALLLMPAKTAEAAGADSLCIPRTNELNGDHHEPDGWLKVEFVNRALIKVEVVPSGRCKTPSDRLMQYLVGSTKFAPLVSGNYYDPDTGDGDWDYRRPGGGGDSDESRVDHFSPQDVEDDLDGNDAILTVNQIRAFRLESELTIGIEEDEVPSASCDGDANVNANFVLRVSGNNVEWDCQNDSVASNRGLRISNSYVGSLENYNITYNYNAEADAIIHVSKNERSTRTFKFCPGEGHYGTNDCTGNYLYIETDKDTLTRLGTGSGSFVIRKKSSDKRVQVFVAGNTSASVVESDLVPGAETSGGGPNGELEGCNALKNPLTWIICPVVTAANEVTDTLDNFIIGELNVEEDKYFDEETAGGLRFYSVWANFRNIGLILLTLVALVMVISQAMSIGPFDAYTIKKVLPRILVAIIFMTLSWDVMKFLLALTNDVGGAVKTIIQMPFNDIPDPDILQGTSGIGSGLVMYAGLSLGILGLLTFAASAFLAAIVAFLVLTIRKMIIILLVLLAPFAIAAYILPNTQKMYKLWWDTLSKALLMFPIIMGFIAVGRVFAKVAGEDGGLLDQLVMIIGYYAPYFMLPMAFRMAGGAIATISGMVNDRSRGMFDRLKKVRQEQPAKRWDRAKHGNLWRGNNPISRRGSEIAMNATQLNKAGLSVWKPSRMRSNMASAVGLQAFDAATEGMEKNQTFKMLKGDDDKLWAITGAKDFDDAKRILRQRAPARFADEVTADQAAAEVMRVKREMGDKVARIAAVRAQAGSGTGFNYTSITRPEIEDDMLDTIISVAGNDRSLGGRMLAEMRGAAKESGRIDLAGGGYAKQIITLDQRRKAMANKEAGGDERTYEVDDDGNFVYETDAAGNTVYETVNGQQVPKVKTKVFTKADARETILRDVLRSNAGAAVAYKVKAVEALAPVMKKDVDAALMSGDAQKAARELASLAGKYEVAGQIAPQNAEMLANKIMSKSIDWEVLPPQIKQMLGGDPGYAKDAAGKIIIQPDGRPMKKASITYTEAIEAMRGNAQFKEMRREYASQADADARRAGAANREGKVITGAEGVGTGI